MKNWFVCRVDIPLGIRVVDPEQKLPAMPPREEPVEQRRADAANMQKPGRTGSKTRTNHGTHFEDE
jgi:hypothetical protein